MDHVLSVYKSIFENVSILFPDSLIAYLGLHWYQELIIDHWVSKRRLCKNVNLSPWAFNCIFRVLKYLKFSFAYKNYPRSSAEVLQVDFSKVKMLYTDLVMVYLGVFWHQKLINGHEKTPNIPPNKQFQAQGSKFTLLAKST